MINFDGFNGKILGNDEQNSFLEKENSELNAHKMASRLRRDPLRDVGFARPQMETL
ncbi:hypothetical protein [Paraburkholderia ginsengisoli]|uniref:Uncharacterized protein n=1 Tax=Paraburkholderia ginsengisoli TaxID=311231 RepID=A0A7T4N462_9BURK|nr:hypothetical protein [Paraburkholderia ginsengisoli]QQC64888.1 hypothetical protein I6I06_05275 [Paraburkholderia ginsengisoli]